MFSRRGGPPVTFAVCCKAWRGQACSHPLLFYCSLLLFELSNFYVLNYRPWANPQFSQTIAWYKLIMSLSSPKMDGTCLALIVCELLVLKAATDPRCDEVLGLAQVWIFPGSVLTNVGDNKIL